MVASAPAMGGAWVAKTASCAPSFGSTTLRVGRRGPLVSLARRTRTPERGTESGWSSSAPALDNRTALSLLGSANLDRPGLRPNGPTNIASRHRLGDHNDRAMHPPQVAERPSSTSIEGKASKLGGIIYM